MKQYSANTKYWWQPSVYHGKCAAADGGKDGLFIIFRSSGNTDHKTEPGLDTVKAVQY